MQRDIERNIQRDIIEENSLKARRCLRPLHAGKTGLEGGRFR